MKITVVSHRKNKAIERAQREFYRHLATLQADLVDGLLLVAFGRRLSYVGESRKQKMSTPLENLENQLELKDYRSVPLWGFSSMQHLSFYS